MDKIAYERKRVPILLALGCFLSFIINGCVVRTYTTTKERLDQDLAKGNRGYLLGKAEVSTEKPKKTTRKLRVIEVELYPKKVEQALFPSTKPEASPPVSPVYIPPSGQETEKAPSVSIPAIQPIIAQPVKSKVVVMKKYTVKKRDTLQSISKKFYGTTKRWKEIYEANQEVLKSPDEIYPGQVIEIPLEEVPGTK